MAKDLKTNFIDSKIIGVLKKFMIFDTLTPNEIREVLTLNAKDRTDYQQRIAKLCQYLPGETVIREGDFDCWSFWVVKGQFDVIQEGVVIASFSRPGEIFGEMSVLEGIPRTASVVCSNGGVCVCIDMSVLDSIENDRIRDMFRKGVYQVILNRLSRTKQTIQAEKQRLETKYTGLLAFEKQIQEKAGKFLDPDHFPRT